MARGFSYLNFASTIDIDAFYEAIEFTPEYTTKNGDDVGYCPDLWGLHKNGDTTGKFAIHREKRVFNCWICGGGTLLSLVMAKLDMDEEEATEWIYQFAGDTEQSDDQFLVEIDSILRAVHAEKKLLPRFNENVLQRYRYENSPWPEEIWEWFTERGISEAVIDRFMLGYGVITKLGPRDRDGKPKFEDYTGPAIIFPLHWQGQLVGWQHRWLEFDRFHTKTPKWLGKYTNTGDFPKEDCLFNFDSCLARPEPPIVVESVPSALFLESNGVSAICTYGSSVTDEQKRLLRRFQQGVILAPDNDSAGYKWASGLRTYLDRFIPIYELPLVGEENSGADLGDFAPDGDALFSHLDSWQ